MSQKLLWEFTKSYIWVILSLKFAIINCFQLPNNLSNFFHHGEIIAAEYKNSKDQDHETIQNIKIFTALR